MVLDLVLGFLFLVAASYVGTTMALRGFFGRERYAPPGETRGDGASRNGDSPGTDDPPRTDDVPRASDVARTDDVARTGDVSRGDAENESEQPDSG